MATFIRKTWSIFHRTPLKKSEFSNLTSTICPGSSHLTGGNLNITNLINNYNPYYYILLFILFITAAVCVFRVGMTNNKECCHKWILMHHLSLCEFQKELTFRTKEKLWQYKYKGWFIAVAMQFSKLIPFV